MLSQLSSQEKQIIRRQERITVALSLLEASEQSTFTKNHSMRVARLSKLIATDLGWPKDQLDLLGRAAIFHDVGKIGIPNTILLKNDALTEEEYTQIKQHPSIGAALIRKFDMKMEAMIVKQHHELLDGSGYPLGLKNENILKYAKIITVADVFDALVSTRPYRNPMTIEQALFYLGQNAETKFDPEAVETLYLIHENEQLRVPDPVDMRNM